MRRDVYVIRHELGLTKIGVATDPKERLSGIQVGSPFEMRLVRSKEVENAERVEKFLHDHFRKYHLRGEWFDIPPQDRGFRIPDRIDDRGYPDEPVDLGQTRRMNTEWADFFERAVEALNTKYSTTALEILREEWREASSKSYGSSDDSDRPDGERTHREIKHDTPPGKLRCFQCAHYYERSQQSCPICGGGDATHGNEGPDLR